MPTLQRVARLLLAGGLTLACGQQPTSSSPSPSPSPVVAGAGFLYVPSSDGVVHGFRVDPETGALSPLPDSPFPGPSEPLSFVPATRMLFGGGYQAPIYRADLKTGALTPFGHLPGEGPLALDSEGRHLYRVGGSRIGPGGIDFIPYPGQTWAYSVDPGTGDTSELSGSPYDGGYFPIGARVTQAGRLLLVCNEGYSGTYVIPASIPSLSVYARNETTGVLSAVRGSPFAVPCESERLLAVTPSGRAIFSSKRDRGLIEGYRLGTDGRPVLASQLAYSSRFDSIDFLTLDPSGQWLFASSSDQRALLVFAVNDEAGVVQRQRLDVHGYPYSRLQVDPSGRFLLERHAGQLYVWGVRSRQRNPAAGGGFAASGRGRSGPGSPRRGGLRSLRAPRFRRHGAGGRHVSHPALSARRVRAQRHALARRRPQPAREVGRPHLRARGTLGLARATARATGWA